jgi:peptidoglycan hydrolase-like protein with peptidoglycan-binding domain
MIKLSSRADQRVSQSNFKELIVLAVYRQGSSGDDVKALQTQLKNAGFDPGGIDGIYGKNTAAAVLAYQKANNLTPDSVAGPQTLGSLTKTTQSAAPASVASKIASEEYQWGPLDPAYKNAIQTGTESSYLKGLDALVQKPASNKSKSSGTNLSGLSNINFGTPSTPAVYKDPYADKINALLDKYLSMDNFSYDPSKDAGLEAAQGDAMAAVDRNAARRGMIYSDSNKSQLGKSALSLIPQFEQAAFSKYQSGLGNILNQLQELQGMSTTGYNRNRDLIDDTRYNTELQMTQADKAKQDYLSTIGQFAENYQLEYNKVRDDGDPSNDWQLPFIQTARQDKIAGLNTAKTKAEQEAYERDMEAKKFGLDERQTNAQIENLRADNARQASAAAEKKASTDAFSSATPEQLNYFNNAFTYLLEQNGRDGYKAYQQLLRESKDYNASMGPKLYNELGKQLQAYGKSQGTPTSINNSTVSSVDDLSAIIKTRFVIPATSDTPQEIDYQGIADYLDSLNASGVDTKITDDLARRWGLNIN